MPRCNFRWTNLPEAVLRGLCRDLDLGGGDPAKTLRSAFGARPTDAFVQTAWPSLRDCWPAHHWEARQLIVEELRQLGLGDGARPANRDAEMASCRSRNSAHRLREVVLDVLISTGKDDDTSDGTLRQSSQADTRLWTVSTVAKGVHESDLIHGDKLRDTWRAIGVQRKEHVGSWHCHSPVGRNTESVSGAIGSRRNNRNTALIVVNAVRGSRSSN